MGGFCGKRENPWYILLFAPLFTDFSVVFCCQKLWSADLRMIHFFAAISRCEKLAESRLCKRITFVENFGAMEKNMRKTRIFYVDFRGKSTVYNAICHIIKTLKTLATSTFFEFFTKFSTPCGKLFPYVRKFFRFSHISEFRENKLKVLSPPRVRFLLTQKLLGTAANFCILRSLQSGAHQ